MNSPATAARGTVALKLGAMAVAFVAVVTTMLAVMVLSLRISESVRAFVTGEGLWTRAQKEAVLNLEFYARTGDEAAYQRYLAAVDATLGDHDARVEMEKPSYDYAVVEQGFVRGGMDARDTSNLIFLFRNFQRISYLRQALGQWRQGDERVDELRKAASELHRSVSIGNRNGVDRTLAEISRINAELAPLEIQFSATLAEGARWVHRTLVYTGSALTLCLLAAGLWAAWGIARQIRLGVGELVKATAQVAIGNLDYQIAPLSNDELGRLGHDFNRMIRDRRDAMAALEGEQQYLQALVGSFVGRVVVCDTRGRIRVLTTFEGETPETYEALPPEQWARTFGLFREDGRTPLAQADVPLYRALHGEVLRGVELVKQVPGFPPRSVLVNAQPIRTASGKRLGAVVSMIDITDRKRAEAELVDKAGALARAEAAREAKSQFLAAMSHEIRTPINGLVGMLELHEGSALDDGQRDSVRVMRDSTLTLMRVIDDILDFSKLEAGQLRIESVPLSLRDVIEGAAESLAASAAARNVSLICHVQPELKVPVLGDPVRLRQVVLNLCANALKFTSQGHVVLKLEARNPRANPLRIRCTVSDTGIGIPAEARPLIFKPFAQAESSTTRRYGGTGLGLSISKGLIERMGGTIGFSSEPGVGSEFWFELYCTTAAVRADPAPASLEGINARIECADPAERAALAAYLRYAGASEAPGSCAPTVVLRDGGTTLNLTGPGGQTHMLGRPVRYNTLLREVARLCGHEVRNVAPAVIVPAVRPELLQGARVLVAEDHATNRLVMRRQLERLGIAADIVEDGARALHQLEGGAYSILITDLHMPGMDGMSLTQAIRQRERGGNRRLPIIGLTADVLPATIDRCQAAGMDTVLRKPTNLDELNRELLRWLARPASAGTPRAA